MLTVVLAVVLPSLGCLAAGLAAGRAWGRAGAEDAYERGYVLGTEDERRAAHGRSLAEGNFSMPFKVPVELPDEGPLVPLPVRLPDADTLTRMYATLGDQEASDDQARQGQGTRLPEVRVLGMDARGGDLAGSGADVLVRDGRLPRLPGEPVTDWDSAEPAERVPTIGELAADAEYRLCWAELSAMRDSARAWYADTFSTGTLPAAR